MVQDLVSEGFQGIEEISQAEPEMIAKIEGIDESTATELIKRSKENLVKVQEEVSLKLKELGLKDSKKLTSKKRNKLVLKRNKSITFMNYR